MKNAALKPTPLRRSHRLATDGEPGDHAAYQEYVRGFDEIPVLQDAVHVPPRPQPPADFRRGERRDVRREQRPDAYSVREGQLAELELLYAEYSRPPPAAARPKRKKAQKRRRKKRAAAKAKVAKI